MFHSTHIATLCATVYIAKMTLWLCLLWYWPSPWHPPECINFPGFTGIRPFIWVGHNGI